MSAVLSVIAVILSDPDDGKPPGPPFLPGVMGVCRWGHDFDDLLVRRVIHRRGQRRPQIQAWMALGVRDGEKVGGICPSVQVFTDVGSFSGAIPDDPIAVSFKSDDISTRRPRGVEAAPFEVRPGEVRPGEVRIAEVRPGEVCPGEVRLERSALVRFAPVRSAL